jgi:hypothetical protein
VPVRSERRYYRQILDALTRSGFGFAALDAETTVSRLFGTVWAAQPVPRDGSFEEAFGLGLVEYAGRRPSPTSLALLRTTAAIAPIREVREAASTIGAQLTARGLVDPQWTMAIGTGPYWAYEDIYGDHTTVVSEFEYGGGVDHHAVVLRIGHLGHGAAIDASVATDVSEVVGGLRRQATSTRTNTLRQVDEGWAKALQAQAIARADLVERVPPRVTDLRALALGRLTLLADGGDPIEATGPDPEGLLVEFLTSQEAQALPDAVVAAEVVEKIVEYATVYDSGRIARVSPTKWDAFLFDWWPSRQISGEVAPVIRAWSSWAARRIALPEPARAELAAALDDMLAVARDSSS